MKKIKYIIFYRKSPDREWDLFEIQMGEPREWGTRNFRTLSQESLTDDQLRVYVKSLAEAHDWQEIIRIQEVLESTREIPCKNLL